MSEYSYQIYILRDDGQMDKFSSPDKDDMLMFAKRHSVKYTVVDTIKEENRTVYIARGNA